MTSTTRPLIAAFFFGCLTTLMPGALFGDEKPNDKPLDAPEKVETPEKKVEDTASPKDVGTMADKKTDPTAQSATPAGTVAKPQGRLPWVKSEAAPAATITRKTVTARELLVNLDDSQLQAFIDGRSLVIDEEESLIRVLFRVPKFGQNIIEEIAHDPGDWKAFFDEPDKHRVQFYRLRGRVQKVERTDMIPEQSDRYDFNHFYRVTMQLADSPNRATICTLSVPETWKKADNLDEPASALGLFLKTGDPAGEHPELVFAYRIAWHPDKVNAALGVLPDHVILAGLGYDISLFDDIRGTNDKTTHNGKDISPEESEAFYQLLTVVKETTQDQLKAKVTLPFELAPLLQSPRKQHGKLMTIQGVARRITRIELETPEFRKRFGMDHYYEVYVYVPLGDTDVRLAGDKNDKQAAVISGAFPISCCVARLPPQWDHLAKGSDDLHEHVRITGFNFKLWVFHTQMLQRYAAEQARRETKDAGFAKTEKRRPQQPSPLFIGPEVEFLPIDKTKGSAAGQAMSFAVIVIFCAIGGMGIALWFFRRSDRVARNAIRKLHQENPGAIIDPTMDPLPDKPDFSGLG